MGIVALVLGLIGVIVALIPWYAITQTLAVLLGIAAVMLGVRARRQAIAERGGMVLVETAGIGLGILAMLLGAVLFASCQGCKHIISRDDGVKHEVERVRSEFRSGIRRALKATGKQTNTGKRQ